MNIESSTREKASGKTLARHGLHTAIVILAPAVVVMASTAAVVVVASAAASNSREGNRAMRENEEASRKQIERIEMRERYKLSDDL